MIYPDCLKCQNIEFYLNMLKAIIQGLVRERELFMLEYKFAINPKLIKMKTLLFNKGKKFQMNLFTYCQDMELLSMEGMYTLVEFIPSKFIKLHIKLLKILKQSYNKREAKAEEFQYDEKNLCNS